MENLRVWADRERTKTCPLELEPEPEPCTEGQHFLSYLVSGTGCLVQETRTLGRQKTAARALPAGLPWNTELPKPGDWSLTFSFWLCCKSLPLTEKRNETQWEKHLLHLHAPKASLTFRENRNEEKKK